MNAPPPPFPFYNLNQMTPQIDFAYKPTINVTHTNTHTHKEIQILHALKSWAETRNECEKSMKSALFLSANINACRSSIFSSMCALQFEF